MCKYVSYIRVSTQRQGQSGLGLEAQQSAVANLIAAESGAELLAEYKDVESGKKNDRRGLTQALAHCKNTGATLIIAKLDRLSRNAAFLLNLRDSGVKFVCADMPQANFMTIGVMAILAQQEREMISQRTKAALAAKRARGEKLGGYRENGFGDGNGQSGREQNKANADARAEKLSTLLLSFKAQGYSLQKMASELNKLGIATARGGKWYAKTVSNYMNRIEG